jgi:hypothetical protein
MERILLALTACFALVQGEVSQEKVSPKEIPGLQVHFPYCPFLLISGDTGYTC